MKTSRHFKLNFYCNGKNLGIGIVIYEPITPHSKYLIGISIRVLWFLAMLKLGEKMQIENSHEIKNKVEKEIKPNKLFVKQLVKFKNNKEAYLVWKWNEFGLMIYNNKSENRSQKGVLILKIFWLAIVYDNTG